MTNEIKLIMALANAMGFDVKIEEGRTDVIRVDIPNPGSRLTREGIKNIKEAKGVVITDEVEGKYIEYTKPTGSINYKVTKKPQAKNIGGDVNVHWWDLDGRKLSVLDRVGQMPVSIFSDERLSIAMANPVLSDCNGIFPNVFTSKDVLICLLDDAGKEINSKWA